MRPVRPPHPFSMYKENKSKGGSHENNEPDYYSGRDDGAHCSWAGRDCGRGEARSEKSRGNSRRENERNGPDCWQKDQGNRPNYRRKNEGKYQFDSPKIQKDIEEDQ